MRRKQNSSEHSGHKPRSQCPIASALDVLGDRWSLLVIRDLALGRERFKDLMSSEEYIPSNILSDRLTRLAMIEQVKTAEGAQWRSYQLTLKGVTLQPVLWSLSECNQELCMSGIFL